MVGRPDSLAVWVKFSQAKANKKHPYATVSAYITDGTRFQDPQDKTYGNVMAKAVNNTIATTGGEWKHRVLPFTYVNDSIDGKAIASFTAFQRFTLVKGMTHKMRVLTQEGKVKDVVITR